MSQIQLQEAPHLNIETDFLEQGLLHKLVLIRPVNIPPALNQFNAIHTHFHNPNFDIIL